MADAPGVELEEPAVDTVPQTVPQTEVSDTAPEISSDTLTEEKPVSAQEAPVEATEEEADLSAEELENLEKSSPAYRARLEQERKKAESAHIKELFASEREAWRKDEAGRQQKAVASGQLQQHYSAFVSQLSEEGRTSWQTLLPLLKSYYESESAAQLSETWGQSAWQDVEGSLKKHPLAKELSDSDWRTIRSSKTVPTAVDTYLDFVKEKTVASAIKTAREKAREAERVSSQAKANNSTLRTDKTRPAPEGKGAVYNTYDDLSQAFLNDEISADEFAERRAKRFGIS